MVKKIYSYIKDTKGGCYVSDFQEVAQGFDTSLENILKGSINDANTVKEMKGSENQVVTLYNDDVLDMQTEFQRKYTENIIEQYKQTNGHYDVVNQKVEKVASNSENAETVKNEQSN